MKQSAAPHEFALFYELLPEGLSASDQFIIDTKDMVHRIERVLRLKEGEQLILFDRKQHARVRIAQMDRTQIVLEVISNEPNKQYSPHITFLLPILKRDALASAVYFLVESGVNEIQLIHSDHQQRTWGGKKELERLERVCIAAAEQSKLFAFPQLKEPVSYEQAISTLPQNGLCVYGNPDGESFAEVVPTDAPEQIVLTCGPEADLSVEEKEMLRAASFHSMRLTPTILRAETAVLCISSLFRTVFTNPE